MVKFHVLGQGVEVGRGQRKTSMSCRDAWIAVMLARALAQNLTTGVAPNQHRGRAEVMDANSARQMAAVRPLAKCKSSFSRRSAEPCRVRLSTCICCL